MGNLFRFEKIWGKIWAKLKRNLSKSDRIWAKSKHYAASPKTFDLLRLCRPNHLSRDFSIRRSTGLMFRYFRISEIRTLSINVPETPLFLHKNLISDACTCGHVLSVNTQDSEPLTRAENGDKNCSANWELCFFRQFSFHDNRIMQLALPAYYTSFAYSDVQFVVLLSITRKYNPKISR